jgi:lipoate-protein ligase B
VNVDLSYFDAIVPCGIAGCEMTSLAQLGHHEIGTGQFAETLADTFCVTFGYEKAEKIEANELWNILEPAETTSIAGASETQRV